MYVFFPSLLPLVSSALSRLAGSSALRQPRERERERESLQAYKSVCVDGGKCVHAVNARGPLIVSRTSASRIDLSHGERQIAVRRSFGSLEDL